MPYQCKDILQEWLLGQVVEYDPKEIVDAFNDVERIIGSKWLDRIYGQARGAAAAIQVMNLGKTLKEVEKIPNGSKLVANIRPETSMCDVEFLHKIFMPLNRVYIR